MPLMRLQRDILSLNLLLWLRLIPITLLLKRRLNPIPNILRPVLNYQFPEHRLRSVLNRLRPILNHQLPEHRVHPVHNRRLRSAVLHDCQSLKPPAICNQPRNPNIRTSESVY